MSEHLTKLAEIDKMNQRSLVWKQVVLWGVLASVAILFSLVGSTLYYYQAELTPFSVTLIAGGTVIVLFLILAVMGNTLSQIALLHKDSALMELRFDVHAAVESVLRETLSRHLPHYTRLHTELDVGEELLRKARQVSERYAQLALKLQVSRSDRALALAIDQMVRDSLLAHGLAADNAAVSDFLDKTGDNIVPIRQSGE